MRQPRPERPATAMVALLVSAVTVVAVVALFVSAAAFVASPAAAGEEGASRAPDFTVQGVDGKTYQLSKLLERGPVLLDFWTTWCKPCMQELPQLQKIYAAYKDRGFTLLGIPSDDRRTEARIKPTIKSKGFDFPNAPDPDRRIGNIYSVRNYPTTVLIAPSGEVALVAQGYRPGDEKELEARIAALLLPSERGPEDEESEETR